MVRQGEEGGRDQTSDVHGGSHAGADRAPLIKQETTAGEWASGLQQAEQTIARLRAEQGLGALREEPLQHQGMESSSDDESGHADVHLTQQGPVWSRCESEDEEDDLNNMADTFKAKLGALHSSLHSITIKCTGLNTELGIADSNSAEFASRLQQAEQTIARLRAEQELGSMREELLQQQVYRLEAMLESDRLQASLSENRLQQLLAEERVRSDRMRVLRDGMASQRDDAVLELASVCADLDAMQATLADSAVYVRYLRKKVLELEVQNSRHAARSALHKPDPQQGDPGVFSLQAIRQKVQEAVREACQCDDEEKKRRLLRQMQLRWHPDKNPLLTEVATEVTKLINEATAQAGL